MSRRRRGDEEEEAAPAVPAVVKAAETVYHAAMHEVNRHCLAEEAKEKAAEDRRWRRESMEPALDKLRRPILEAVAEFRQRRKIPDDTKLGPVLTQGNDTHLYALWCGRLRVTYEPSGAMVMGYQIRMLSPEDDETYVPLPAAVVAAADLATLDQLDEEQTVAAVMRLFLAQPALRNYRTSDGVSTVNPPGVVHWEPKALDYRVNRTYWKRYDAANGPGKRPRY